MNKYQRQLDRLCRRSNNPVPEPKPLTGIEKEIIEEQVAKSQLGGHRAQTVYPLPKDSARRQVYGKRKPRTKHWMLERGTEMETFRWFFDSNRPFVLSAYLFGLGMQLMGGSTMPRIGNFISGAAWGIYMGVWCMPKSFGNQRLPNEPATKGQL
jgi:hypothetical protein